jgi:hypothetical protein
VRRRPPPPEGGAHPRRASLAGWGMRGRDGGQGCQGSHPPEGGGRMSVGEHQAVVWPAGRQWFLHRWPNREQNQWGTAFPGGELLESRKDSRSQDHVNGLSLSDLSAGARHRGGVAPSGGPAIPLPRSTWALFLVKWVIHEWGLDSAISNRFLHSE